MIRAKPQLKIEEEIDTKKVRWEGRKKGRMLIYKPGYGALLLYIFMVLSSR